MELTSRFQNLNKAVLLKLELINTFSSYLGFQSAGAVEYIESISAEGHSLPNACPQYDTKKFDGEAPVMLELWEMQNIFSLPSLRGPL